MNTEFDPNLVYMSPTQVCKYLGINPGHLRSLVWSKQIENVLVAGKVMFYRTEVENMKDKVPPVREYDSEKAHQTKLKNYGLPENGQFTKVSPL